MVEISSQHRPPAPCRRRTAVALALLAFVVVALAAAPMVLGLKVHLVEETGGDPALAIVRTVPVGDLVVGDTLLADDPAGHRSQQIVEVQPGRLVLGGPAAARTVLVETAAHPTAPRVLASTTVPGVPVLVALGVLGLLAAAAAVVAATVRVAPALRRWRLSAGDTPAAG